MKPVRFISAGVLLLSLGALTPMYAQHDQHGQDAQPSKQEQQAKPEKQQQGQQKQQQARGQQNQQQQRAQQQQQQARGQQNQQQQRAQQQQSRPEDSRTSSNSAPSNNNRPEDSRTSSNSAPSNNNRPERQRQQQQQAKDSRTSSNSAPSNNNRPEDSRTSTNSAPSSNSRARKDSGNNSSRPGGSRIGSSNSAPPERPAQLRPTPQRQRNWQQQQRTTWQQHRARNWDSEHRSWQQRGGYNGYRVPDDYYRAHYGQIIGSTSGAYPLWSWAGIRAFSTMAIGSRFLTPIRITGETIGTRPTMFTLTTGTAGITSTIAGILAVPGLRSVFRSEWKPQNETVAA